MYEALEIIEGGAALKNKVRDLILDVVLLASEEDKRVYPIVSKRVPRYSVKTPVLPVYTLHGMSRVCEGMRGTAYFPALMLMSELGIRPGEAVAQFAGDIDPIGNLNVVRQDDGKGGWTLELKTEESERIFPVPSDLLDEFKALTDKKGRTRRPGDYLSMTPTGTHPSENNTTREVAKVCD